MSDDHEYSSDDSGLYPYDDEITENRGISSGIPDIPCYHRYLAPVDATVGEMDVYMQYQYGIPYIPSEHAAAPDSACIIHSNKQYRVSWPEKAATFTLRPQLIKVDTQETLYHGLGVTAKANPGDVAMVKGVMKDVMGEFLSGDLEDQSAWTDFGEISKNTTIQDALTKNDELVKMVSDRIAEGLKAYQRDTDTIERSEPKVMPDVEVPSGGFVLECETGWGVWCRGVDTVLGAVLPVVVVSRGQGNREGLFKEKWSGQLLIGSGTSNEDQLRMQAQIDAAQETMTAGVIAAAQNILADRGTANVPRDGLRIFSP